MRVDHRYSYEDVVWNERAVRNDDAECSRTCVVEHVAHVVDDVEAKFPCCLLHRTRAYVRATSTTNVGARHHARNVEAGAVECPQRTDGNVWCARVDDTSRTPDGHRCEHD